MGHTILFSDVHLKPMEDGSGSHQSFIAFLRHIDPEATTRLICLGDLFDFWFEYRHSIFSGYFEALRAFADLQEAGVELHLVCGNHDFWAGDFLARRIGFQLHHGPVRLPFGEKEALLLHGDGLNPRDYGYRLFKRLARNPLLLRLFRRVHPDTAMAIARGLSRSSRALATPHASGEGSEARLIRRHAHHLLESGQAEIVICGHAHAPTIETVAAAAGEGMYINPGDWPHHRSYVVWDGASYALSEFRYAEPKHRNPEE